MNIKLGIPFVIAGILSGCGFSETPVQPSASSSQMTVAVQNPPSVSPDSEELWQQALSAYQNWDEEKALQLCNRALAADPRNYKALSTKGIVTAFHSSPEKGIQMIQQALSIYPDYTAGFYDMAMALKLSGQYDESIQWFLKVLKKDPANTWSYYGIATIYADRGQKEPALDYLRKAASLDPTAVKAAASEQAHFKHFRGDPDFQKILSGP